MAFIDVDPKDDTENAIFYNLNSAVGYGQRNTEEDVKVVQFFLNRVYTIPKHKGQKPAGNMVIDGKVGPITRNWILKTQMFIHAKGAPMVVDGVVDKASDEYNKWYGSISDTWYTIRVLNFMLRQDDSAVYKTLSTNPVVPPDVRLIFQQMNAEGPAMNFGPGAGIHMPMDL